MILDKKIEVTIAPANQKHYVNLDYKNVEIFNKIIVKTTDLPKKSHVKINVKCDVCEKEKQLPYVKYIKNTKSFTQLYCCCEKCAMFKNEKTKNEKYGDKNYNNIEKFKQTRNNKSKDEESVIIKKREETCFKKFGYRNPMQHPDIWKQQQKTSCKIFKYKETDLYTQGSYELYFIQLMDNYDFINDVRPGKLYNYVLNGKNHVYHSDFLFKDITIEIKSTKTYNENGKNKFLELENETKWKAVRDNGDSIIVLFSKEEIKKYVESLLI